MANKDKNNIYDWYENLLKIMDYGDDYSQNDEGFVVTIKGLYCRTRARLYTGFLFKYGVTTIVVNLLYDNENKPFYTIKTDASNVNMMHDKIYSVNGFLKSGI